MIALYAGALVVGVVALVAWMVLSAAAGLTTGSSRFDPDRRFGAWGRRLVAGLVGVGMGGVSATYAGWSTVLALVAACIGGVFLALVTDRLAPRDA